MGAAIVLSLCLFLLSRTSPFSYRPFFWLMLISGSAFSLSLVRNFTSKKNLVAELMLPVSAAERIWAMMLFGVALYPLTFCLVIWPFFAAAQYVFNDVFGYFELKLNPFHIGFFVRLYQVCFIQTCLIGISFFFRRQALLKGCITVIIGLMLFTAIDSRMNSGFFDRTRSRFPATGINPGLSEVVLRRTFMGARLKTQTIRTVRLPAGKSAFLVLGLILAIPLAAATGWLRLKERRI